MVFYDMALTQMDVKSFSAEISLKCKESPGHDTFSHTVFSVIFPFDGETAMKYLCDQLYGGNGWIFAIRIADKILGFYQLCKKDKPFQVQGKIIHRSSSETMSDLLSKGLDYFLQHCAYIDERLPKLLKQPLLGILTNDDPDLELKLVETIHNRIPLDDEKLLQKVSGYLDHFIMG